MYPELWKWPLGVPVALSLVAVVEAPPAIGYVFPVNMLPGPEGARNIQFL